MSPVRPETIVDLFSRAVNDGGDRLAIVDESGTLTYDELNRHTDALAHALLSAGVKQEDAVGICLRPSRNAVVGLLGILKAGGAYVPLDPAAPVQRRSLIAESAGVRVAVVDGTTVDLPAGIWTIDLLPTRIAEQPFVGPAVAPRQLAYVLYTSGSTGAPKGVMVEHASVVNLVDFFVRLMALEPSDRLLQFAPIGFDVSVWEIFTTLGAGATLCVPAEATRRDTTLLTRFLRENKVTVVDLVPGVLRALSPEQLPDIRIVMSGMEAFPTELVQQWRTDGRRFFNGYGPTEATVVCVVGECFGNEAVPPIGQPVDGVTLSIVADEDRPVRPGEVGELLVGGICLARGYAGQATLTAERFIQVPGQQQSTRMYRTGDLVQRCDGRLVYVGRVDDQVKIRGMRVEPREIAHILQTHPQVGEAAVVAVGDTLVAFIDPASTKQVAHRERLASFLAKRLPEHMRPRRYVFLSPLPRLDTGKLDLQSLRDAAATWQEPDGLAPLNDQPDEVERALLEIVADVLEVDHVTLDATFDGLGRDSLSAMRIQTRIGEQFGVDLDVEHILACSDLRAAAELVRHPPINRATMRMPMP